MTNDDIEAIIDILTNHIDQQIQDIQKDISKLNDAYKLTIMGYSSLDKSMDKLIQTITKVTGGNNDSFFS